MTQIAIDIVLLPDEATQKICREINSEIGGKIDFTNTGKVPHISLMMGIIDESGLDEIQNKLSEISKKYGAITTMGNLNKTHLIQKTGDNLVSYGIDQSTGINMLFSDIAANIRPMLSYKDISKNMFYTPGEIDMKTIVVGNFEHRSPEEYSSHITLGTGELEGNYQENINISLPRLAIFQLGNYCTCENKLFEIEL